MTKSKKKIIVLGAGMVGSAIAKDLSSRYDVSCADISEQSLNRLSNSRVHKIRSDLSEKQPLKKLVEPFDFVVCAVPGFMGFETLKSVIEAKKNIVDISFFAEDPFALNRLAKNNNVCVITDCGVAPGMCNIIAGYHDKKMHVTDYKCYVGGLPKIRKWPFQYKAVFSPTDVIEEYIRPARFMVNGQVITKEALSDPEMLHFDKIGTLEAFNSDGLRSMLFTLKIPNMAEKTLRYQGSMDIIRAMRKSGFFSKEKILVNKSLVSPLDVTAKILSKEWLLEEGEQDFTVMKIEIKGMENGQKKSYDYFLYDEYDALTHTTSMARTTGYTATAVTNLILDGEYFNPGINPPEYIGMIEKNLFYILQYLKERGIVYQVKEDLL